MAFAFSNHMPFMDIFLLWGLIFHMFSANLSYTVPSHILVNFLGHSSTWKPPYCPPSSLTGTKAPFPWHLKFTPMVPKIPKVTFGCEGTTAHRVTVNEEGRQYGGHHIWPEICHIKSIFGPKWAFGIRLPVNICTESEFNNSAIHSIFYKQFINNEAKQNGGHHISLEISFFTNRSKLALKATSLSWPCCWQLGWLAAHRKFYCVEINWITEQMAATRYILDIGQMIHVRTHSMLMHRCAEYEVSNKNMFESLK